MITKQQMEQQDTEVVESDKIEGEKQAQEILNMLAFSIIAVASGIQASNGQLSEDATERSIDILQRTAKVLLEISGE